MSKNRIPFNHVSPIIAGAPSTGRAALVRRALADVATIRASSTPYLDSILVDWMINHNFSRWPAEALDKLAVAIVAIAPDDAAKYLASLIRWDATTDEGVSDEELEASRVAALLATEELVGGAS